MNDTDIDARICFARSCNREANRAAERGESHLAAELRTPAQRVIAEASAATAHLRQVSPAQDRARAFAQVIAAGLGRLN